MADTTLSDVTTLVRYLIEDTSTNNLPGDIFVYANSAVFTLTESNVIEVTQVLVNDSSLGSGDYSYDVDDNSVQVVSSLSSGDTIEIQYSYYANYSDSIIQNYIRSAVIHLSINNYYNFEVVSTGIYPEPSTTEKNLIAMVASLLINPGNQSIRLPDITINVPNDLPTNTKIAKVINVAKHNTTGIFSLL